MPARQNRCAQQTGTPHRHLGHAGPAPSPDTQSSTVDAAALRPAESNPFLTLGLWGLTPDVDLAAARDALARGDLEGSIGASDRAAATWDGAEATGQGRAISIGLLIAALVVGLATMLLVVRRRRRRRPAMAHRATPSDPKPTLGAD